MSYVTNNGIRIHYQVEGQGMPLVLQHGLSESLEGWYDFEFVERLKYQFQLIMIDARGHGASDKPHDAAAYDLKLMVGDVVAVLTQLRLDRVHYYGNSMGCRIGFGMAKYAPQFIRAFIMGGHHPYAESRQFFRQIFAQGLETWVNLLEDMAGPISSKTKQRMFSNDLEALRAVVAKDHPDISDILPTMNMSCRLFAGSQDPDTVGEFPKQLN
ncbi:alpha/beta hydrolase [Anabaena minutissima FACHB-250]|nr:alpha/beta hydrolase [Anabaena minutissima FACHB-250]